MLIAIVSDNTPISVDSKEQMAMMATTHALAGLLLGAVALLVAPDFASVAMLAGFAGGVFPDLDLPGKHRKTLHFPVYYSVLAVPSLFFAVLIPTVASVGFAVFLLAAAPTL